MTELDDLPPFVKLHVAFARERFIQKKENRSQILVAIREDAAPLLAFLHADGDIEIGQSTPFARMLKTAVDGFLCRGPFANVAFFSEGWAHRFSALPPEMTMDDARDRHHALQRRYGPSMEDWPPHLRDEVVLIVVAEPLRVWNISIPFTRTGGGVVLHEDRAMAMDTDHGATAGGDIVKQLRRLVRLKPEQAN